MAAAMLPGPNVPGLAPATAALLATGQQVIAGAGRLPGAVRRRLAGAMARLGPAPGDGPRPEALDEWSYRIDVHAVTASGETADVVVEAQGHPGVQVDGDDRR